MLHHGHVAVGRAFLNLDLVFFNVGELHFLVLLGFGIDRRAGEGGVERGLAGWFVAIAHQLQVQLRRHRHGANVLHLMLDLDGIRPTVQGVGLDQLDAAELRRLKAQHQLFAAVLELALARQQGHHGLVGGQAAASHTGDQPGLRHVHAVFAVIQQYKIALLVGHVDVLEELRLQQRAAFGVEGELEHVGGDDDAFTRHRWGTSRGGGWYSCAWYSLGASQRGRHGRWRWHGGDSGRTGRARTGRSRRGLAWGREKSGLVTGMHLPLVPQQHHGKAKNHPQNGAANIVHEDFSGVDEGNSRVKSPGFCLGTGSKPPSHQG